MPTPIFTIVEPYNIDQTLDIKQETPVPSENLFVPNKINTLNHNQNLSPISDIDDLVKLRRKLNKNPMFAYYNINSLRNKLFDIQEIVAKFR